jgi:DnaD/phage-associated family protein
MPSFKGFPEGKLHLTPIPDTFFRELLPQMDQLTELKVILHIFWRLDHMEGAFRFVRRSDLDQDETLLAGLAQEPSTAQAALDDALQRATARGVILRADLDTGSGVDAVYFLNSPKGRAALRAIQNGQWRISEAAAPTPIPPETPNIYRLYEENFGPLTPLLAETLGEAQDTYPIDWIADAMRIAVERNKRTWRYVAAILDRWQREGRHASKEKPQDRPDSAEARRKYVEGEFSDFVEH